MNTKISGTIKWYNTTRGFGVIESISGNEYFLHLSRLSPDIGKIRKSARLLFEIIPRPVYKGGYEAIHVKMDNSWSRSIANHAQLTDLSNDGKCQCKPAIGDTKNPLSDIDIPTITKVIGVTYEGRQAIVALLRVGEEVLLVREPNNPYDGNAIKVTRKDGQCFGFIGKSLAVRLALKLDEYGQPIVATVLSLNGGYFSNSNSGVMIQFHIESIQKLKIVR